MNQLVKTFKSNLGTIASFCTILTLMFFLFATQWDLDALAQTVDRDRCKDAKIKIAEYEAAMLMGGVITPSPLMAEAIAELEIIIAESCPKKNSPGS